MKHLIWFSAILAVWFSPCFALDSLDTYRAKFEQEIEAADASYSLEALRVVNLYVTRLEQLDESARMNGDMDLVSEIREEIRRVRGDRSLPSQLSEQEALANVKTILAGAFHSLEVTRAQRIVSLAESYAELLVNVQRTLVQQNNIDGALSVRDEREGVEERERVVTARALMERADQPPRLSRKRPEQVPEDAVEFRGRVFALVQKEMTWEEAMEFCRDQGGRLASPDSDEGNELFRQLQEQSRKPRVYLGAHDSKKEGSWMDAEDAPLRFQKWANGEPNNAGEREDVAEMRLSGEWNDVPADMRIPFFCEW